MKNVEGTQTFVLIAIQCHTDLEYASGKKANGNYNTVHKTHFAL